MTQDLPPPLVPAGVVLRDFAYMPLDVVRLRDSGLVAAVSAEAFRCAVLLWCASWHQVPAGSLPDDEVLLSGYAGFGRAVREWKKHREGALHGWVKCSDGRLYHPVIAEKAIEAQQERHKHAYRTECMRIKTAAQRQDVKAVYPTFEEWLTAFLSTRSKHWQEPQSVPGDSDGVSPPCPPENAEKGREGKGREGIFKELCTSNNAANLESTEALDRVVNALRGYGYQVNNDSAESRHLAAIKATNDEIAEACKAAKPAGWNPMGRTKPIAWVLSRIEGRRSDSPAQGEAVPVQVDPAIAARQAADRKLEDALIGARQLESTGIIQPEERAVREREARAAHAASVGALGAAA